MKKLLAILIAMMVLVCGFSAMAEVPEHDHVWDGDGSCAVDGCDAINSDIPNEPDNTNPDNTNPDNTNPDNTNPDDEHEHIFEDGVCTDPDCGYVEGTGEGEEGGEDEGGEDEGGEDEHVCPPHSFDGHECEYCGEQMPEGGCQHEVYVGGVCSYCGEEDPDYVAPEDPDGGNTEEEEPAPAPAPAKPAKKSSKKSDMPKTGDATIGYGIYVGIMALASAGFGASRKFRK